MFERFILGLRAAEDKFTFVLGEPLTHKIAASAPLVTELRAAVEANLIELAEQDSANLGIILATRRYQDVATVETFAWLDAKQKEYERNERMRIRIRVVRASLLGSRGLFMEAYDEFAACVTGSRYGDDDHAFAFASKGLGDMCLFLGRYVEGERAYEDALVTFRRWDVDVWAAFVINNLGVLKRRLCEYDAALRLLSQARSIVERLDITVSILDANISLGVVLMRRGDWKAARTCFERAMNAAAGMEGEAVTAKARELWRGFTIPFPRLLALQRRFVQAEPMLLSLVDACHAQDSDRALVHEHLGEMYTDLGRPEEASEHLAASCEIALQRFPESEQMAEVLRRQAQLSLCTSELDDASQKARQCIRLSKRIGDRYELGAAVRVLGEIYVAQERPRRAEACFRTAIRMLRSIHECYELMRTLYAYGRFIGRSGAKDEAETALLEARQLARKLELDYYQALIAIAMADMLGPEGRFDEANRWLAEASGLREQLEGVDHDRVEGELKRCANQLQNLITRASVKAAEELKTICRVYEDARFPFEDMRADLAYQVAQSIGADSLFVIGRHGGGFRVPLTYNISINDAKDIVRRLENGGRKKALLGVESDPNIHVIHDGRALLAVPCREIVATGSGTRSGDDYVACACFESRSQILPRQLELFCAAGEALARLIEEEELRRGGKAAAIAEDGEVSDDRPARARHPRGSFKDIITIDTEMIKVIKMAEKAAMARIPILLEGETGVGKELFARAIHDASERREGPFVAINAGGMSVHLLESELFGHVRGAFTDASADRTGLVEMARGGTLFMDEVGEMGEEMQVKLLRLLENREYRRLGESVMRTADVRVISATNRDLKKEMERGGFRRDLYYRLSTVKITVPPLRMRRNDIQLLTRYFLRDCARLNGIADRYIEIDVKAMEALELYEWPGNVRELYNEILRAVSLIGRGDLVKFAMLSEHIKDALKERKRSDGLLDRSVEQYERRLILDALEKNDWNNVRTADALAIPRTTLITKLRRMGIVSK